MAKKKVEEQAAPVISPIPIAATDSPLVIDLPDGQKLVVGQMPTGTVIEVATWRGTGRPDSRTSRLMLGMSSPEEASSSSNQQVSENQPTVANKRIGKIKLPNNLGGLLGKILKFAGFGSGESEPEIKAEGSTQTKKLKLPSFKPSLKSKRPRPKLSLRSEKKDSLDDPDFQNWLESITKKNEKLANFNISEVSKDKIKPSSPKKTAKPRRGK